MNGKAFYLGGKWKHSETVRTVNNPFDGRVAGEVCQASPADITAAITAAHEAFAYTRRLSSMEKHRILTAIAAGVEARKEEFARMITLETGKPIRLSRVEADRTVFTFSIAAEESRHIEGTVLPLDLNAQSVGRFGLVKRFALGPVGAITPFNYPLNLVAHKVAPAIAAGNPVVLKPSSNSPLVSLLLAEVIDKTDLPKGAFSVIPCRADESSQLVSDERIKALSFTGSPAVGWPLKSAAGKKRVVLELGGNAGVIVEPGVDLKSAAQKIVMAGFSGAGQSCISVQRVFLHESIWEHARKEILDATAALDVGDPFDEKTLVGPMITEQAAIKIEGWIREAVNAGARLACGGTRRGALMAPTILENVQPDMKVSCMEAFAPLITLERYSEFAEAVRRVNASSFGLQAGLFTNDLGHALHAFEDLEVGGVVLNDVPTYRIDHMPYGGVKDSGFGREGIRYAIEEMMELKLLVVSPA